MPIRICSEAAGLEECFVEVDERWSIRELNRIYDSRDAWLELFGRKVLAVHLLTAEAFGIYLSHLAEGGVLAVHISTQHLDLQSVVWKLAEHLGLKSCWIESYEDPSTGALASDWILLSRTGDIFNQDVFRIRKSIPCAELKRVPLWTDDHINLLKILKKKKG